MVFNDQGDVLLIKRGKNPQYGRWMVPGGTLEWGETLEQAAKREVLEETGIVIEIEDFVEIIEAITPGDTGFHYVIMDYVARPISGVLTAGSDALEAAWVPVESFPAFDLSDELLRVIGKARRLSGLSP